MRIDATDPINAYMGTVALGAFVVMVLLSPVLACIPAVWRGFFKYPENWESLKAVFKH